MKKGKRMTLMLSGMLLMFGAAGLTAYNLHEDSLAAVSSSEILQKLYDEREQRIRSAEDAIPTGISGEIIEAETLDPNAPMPVIMIDGKAYIGTLSLPAFGIELPVAADWDYAQMKISPCRYVGSAYSDDLVICAHNYSAHFRSIRDLQANEEVIFIDAMGNEFNYQVVKVETIEPTAIDQMINSDADLSLFTCNAAGNARVTVRCERMEEF